MTSLLHCGAVGNAVNIPNATGACAGGVPVLVSCDPGWFNVNGSLVDGCEFREDAFEPNDSSAAARFLAWGSMITANVAPQGDEDWFRYNASCTFFDTCSPRSRSAAAARWPLRGRHPGRIRCRRPALPRTQDHTYTVRITGTYGSSYSLNANEG